MYLNICNDKNYLHISYQKEIEKIMENDSKRLVVIKINGSLRT